MASYNKVILMGNLTRDPVIRYAPSGTPVSDFGLAINETYKNKAGEQVEKTCFVDVSVWSRQAETCNEYLSKGSPVLLEGSLELDKWQTKDGENRSKLRVRANRVQFLSKNKESSYQQSENNKAQSNPETVAGEPEAEDSSSKEISVKDNAENDENLPF